jgi:hypothetical protein
MAYFLFFILILLWHIFEDTFLGLKIVVSIQIVFQIFFFPFFPLTSWALVLHLIS